MQPVFLKILKPLDDPNIVYNFHFYEPFVFTHQGASWIDTTMASLHDVPYPSSNGRCGKLPDFGDATANDWAGWYCTGDTWDAQHIASRIQEAVDWAKQYGVRLTCNEFGVYPPVAPPEDRLQWFRDVHSALEKQGIGWTVWGYDDAFGLGYSALQPMDAGVLDALGLVQQ